MIDELNPEIDPEEIPDLELPIFDETDQPDDIPDEEVAADAILPPAEHEGTVGL